MNDIEQAQQAFREAMAAGKVDQIERTSERIRLAQKARRMRQATSRTLRVALALDITL